LSDPQQLNSYSYARNNPIVNKDPSGEILDTILDIGFIAYDLYDLGRAYLAGEDTSDQLLYLGMDIAGAAIPVATGLGLAARTAKAAEKVAKAAELAKVAKAEKVVEAVETVNDISKAGDVVADAGKTVKITPQALGRAGEELSGLTKNTERIPSATKTANFRIPDGLDHSTKMVSEVKNVKYQSFSNQIKDSLIYSKNNEYGFELITRPDTRISGPLQSAIDAGDINLKFLIK
jgi:hypothetical protein